MDVTGFLAIGNGEKCPFCEKIMEEDTDTLGHLMNDHPEKMDGLLFNK